MQTEKELLLVIKSGIDLGQSLARILLRLSIVD